MKVLLLKAIKGLGQANDLIEVSEGYANNKLIPQKLAIPASSNQAKDILKKTLYQKQGKENQQKKVDAKVIEVKSLTITAKANSSGALYKSITVKDVIESLKKSHHIEVSEKQIALEPDHIKELGKYQVSYILQSKSKHNIELTIIEAAE